jgi:hypothetical protein
VPQQARSEHPNQGNNGQSFLKVETIKQEELALDQLLKQR